MSKRTRALAAIAVGAIVGLLACNDRPPGSPVAPLPPGATPMITRIEIGGPASVPPGEDAQLSATARLTDGSSRDVTTEAHWNSANPTVLSVSPEGRATGHQAGEAMVSANIGPALATSEVIVIPRSTFRIVGLVTEADGRSAAVVGAIIIVGGNIEGFTRTMTTAIALETSKGDLPLAMGLGIVLIAIVFAVNALAWTARRAGERFAG